MKEWDDGQFQKSRLGFICNTDLPQTFDDGQKHTGIMNQSLS
jgi:hypothetical protein